MFTSRDFLCGDYNILSKNVTRAGFSKRIEIGVSIYKVGGELSDGGSNPITPLWWAGDTYL